MEGCLPVDGASIRWRPTPNLRQQKLAHQSVARASVQESQADQSRCLHHGGHFHVAEGDGQQRGQVEAERFGDGRVHGARAASGQAKEHT